MNKETDRELLELAAKAAGIPIYESVDGTIQNRPVWVFSAGGAMGTMPYEVRWNPLVDDAQALRLAVAMGLEIYHADDEGMAVYVGYPNPDHEHYGICYAIEFYKDHAGDACAATRRAIVRAAAETGKETQCY